MPHTYGYYEASYGIQNEHGVQIAESTCGAKSIGKARDPATGEGNLFWIGELSKIALERCNTSRCAVQTMGRLAVDFGSSRSHQDPL